ncbi:MAG: 1-deoxy-D-xylulose-5-phosphate synthase [Candidatus Kappaea frigidicola]|nr:1-deoxy-D-xylulose-5-phosphate synthase [Candidatus Kappaea frigidicola]
MLSKINSPIDLRKLPLEKLDELSSEVRQLVIDTVSETGGHLASSLGVVELTVALHYIFNTPEDKLVWDVGHQCYPHKILTGRRDKINTLRQFGGLSGFPNKDESSYDVMTSGHSSTSVSFALGLAAARDIEKKNNKVIAVIGDGALSGGESFEAMNNAGQMGKDLIIVLNSNDMSISESVGALSSYLTRLISEPLFNKVRNELRTFVSRIPKVGPKVAKAARKFEEGLKNLIVPGIFFEELGFTYYGPIDGHDMKKLVAIFQRVSNLGGPRIVHVVTTKGKGYKPAESDPATFHGLKPFDKDNGIEEDKSNKNQSNDKISFTQVFSDKICKLAKENDKIVAVTAAMPCGTGLDVFAKKYPERFFDVGIAEQHALTFSAGMAKEGLSPITAIYSTFLQRGYDQIFHDICLQELGVVLAIDRAGIVGQDGITHQGVFDIAYLRNLPKLVIMAPKDANDFEAMLDLAVSLKKPVAIRYPRAKTEKPTSSKPGTDNLKLGQAKVLKEGKDITIISCGPLANIALEAAAKLDKEKISVQVIDLRFIKPLDNKIIDYIKKTNKCFVTIEEGVRLGGAGSAVLELLEANKITDYKARLIGLPDEFIEHGTREELFNKYGLTIENVTNKAKEILND